MAFAKLSYEKNWTKAEDFPAYQSDEMQVRADLQYHPDAVKTFINDTLLQELEDKTAANTLGAVDADGEASNIQSVLNDHGDALAQLGADIETLAAGGVPTQVQSVAVSFSAGSWVTVSGAATLTIPKKDHKRENANFGYNLYQLVGSAYKSGTWGTATTGAAYNSDGSITLTADEAYTGKIVFFGL